MALVNLAATTQVWKDFEFAELQRELDNEATSIALRQDQSEITRKALVELNKEFKRNSSDETRKSVSSLIKSFQIEVDSLSKRAKASEAAFLSVYRKLIDAPDPWPALEQVQTLQKKLSKQNDAELEAKQLRETLEEYSKEFVEVKNQEVTIKQLKEKVKGLEENTDRLLEERMKARSKELDADFAEKENRLEEEKIRVATKLGIAEQEVALLQNALVVAQTELLDFKSRLDQKANAKSAEYDLLSEELERLTDRALTAEGRVAALEDEKEQMVSQDSANQIDNFSSRQSFEERRADELGLSAMEVELRAKQKEVDQLVEDVQQLQSTLRKSQLAVTNQAAEYEQELKAALEDVEILKNELDLKSDYDEMKKELNILKSMECGTDPDEGSSEHSLEVLLLVRNRALMNENTRVKVALSSVKESAAKLESENSDLRREASESKSLVARLEEHILHVGSVTSMPAMVRSEAEGASSPPLPVTSSLAESSVEIDEGREVEGAAMETHSTSSAELIDAFANQQRFSGESSATDSLLNIVSSQRERFRHRNQELESENIAYKNRVQYLQADLDRMRGDNLKLYEKIKFLQSNFSGQTSANRSRLHENTESRYAGEYEQELDPFQSFARKERNRKYALLRPHEKATLHLVRFILGSAGARSFAFFYSVFLHLLVFVVLYRFSLVEDCLKDQAEDCAKTFANHMLQVHGTKN